MSNYITWLEENKKLFFRGYNDLWKWSVSSVEDFWESMWEYFGIVASGNYSKILSSRTMPGAKWFEGSFLNYAEHAFRGGSPDKTAIIFQLENGKRGELSYSQLRRQVGAVASWLKEAGLTRGDRVAAYLPNVPEAVIALLASSSIGAVWSSCSPDFGGPSVIDRFAQIKPRILFGVESYNYNGKSVDKKRDLSAIIAAIPSIERRVLIPSYAASSFTRNGKTYAWDDVVERAGKLEFERVPFDHPLWILYSSGTTGPPKPIVQCHGGILLEHYKILALHNNLKSDSRFFWFTSTGWMMWNYLVGGLLTGSTILLYDGSASYPNMNRLWEFCERDKMTFFGTSPPYIAACIKSGINPRESFGLNALKGVLCSGAPLSSEDFRWIYENVKEDLWLSSISGGTDVCTAFVGGCPTLPVQVGRIQCRCLGAKVEAFDENGKSVYDEPGELVLTEPMPSMPIFFWDDPGNKRYLESYFNLYPGVWRHGDWISISIDGTCVIYGRSDATIKRMGVRLGSSEIYKIVESMPEVLDSLVVSLEFLDEKSLMPLFVVLREGASLDDSLKSRIKGRVRTELSPRFVPDEIVAVPAIPMTLNGKKAEIPVRKILMGTSYLKAVNPDSLKNPESMRFFESFGVKLRKTSSHS